MQLRTFYLLLSFPVFALADVNGADPRLTGAPGDNQQACTACHTGTALNGGPGSIKITAPGGSTYTPGVKQRLAVSVSDPSQKRWGFELSARPSSNLTSGRAGDLASVDANTKVICETRTCSATSIQFVTHTQTGTRLGTTGGATFEFDWTPPSTASGDVVLYAAGNAANGNTGESGDRIYTTKLTLSPAAGGVKPTISSTDGVVNGASFQASIAQGAYVTIKGTNLAPSTRLWAAADLPGGKLPTSLDGVSVTINNKPAYVEYISPTQINVIAPADSSTGQVEVKVTSGGQTSDAVTTTLQPYAPAFFTYDGKYLAATHSDNALLGKNGLFSSAPSVTTPAKPGETIILYGTGFGATNPAIRDGQQTDRIAPLATSAQITVGGQTATVAFAGLVPPFANLYQFNVTVPSGLADGDQAVVAEIGGVASMTTGGCCFITVGR